MSLSPFNSTKLKDGTCPSLAASLRERAISLIVAVLPVPGTPDMYMQLCICVGKGDWLKHTKLHTCVFSYDNFKCL